MRILLSAIPLLMLTACVTSFLDDPMLLGISSPADQLKVQDKREWSVSSRYNVFSCGHGISRLDDDQFATNPIQLIDYRLKRAFPQLYQNGAIELTRFDVYFNRQLATWNERQLAMIGAGAAVGGVTGDALIMAGSSTNDPTGLPASNPEEIVGCAGAETGEFSIRELGPGAGRDSTPLITFISVTINGREYKGRGFKDSYSISDHLYYVQGDVRDSVNSASSSLIDNIAKGENLVAKSWL